MNLHNHDFINIDGNYIHKTAIIGENTKLGKNNVIMPYVVIGQPGFIRDMDEPEGRIEIGDDNWIGCHAIIMAGKEGVTSIGDNNMIMNYVNIGHNVIVGNHNEIGAKTIFCGFVKIGDRNSIKVSVSVRNRIKIGNHNLIGMGGVVINDISNHKKLYGNPAKII